MTRIGVRELRQHASRYLDLVKAGETVEVTERGVLVAVLSPPTSAQTARERLIAEGRLTPARGPRVLPPRVASPPGTPSLSDLLTEARADSR
jgi:prevent-host-death family protein